MSIFDLYKPFRNKVTPLAVDDSLRVIWAYAQYLRSSMGEILPSAGTLYDHGAPSRA